MSNSTGQESSNATTDHCANRAAYESAAAVYLYNDHLMWSRFQTLMFVQVSVLAGAYALKNIWLGAGTAFLGCFLTATIWVLTRADYRDRQRKNQMLVMTWKRIATAVGGQECPDFQHPITEQPPWKKSRDAATLANFVMGFFLMLDFLLGAAITVDVIGTTLRGERWTHLLPRVTLQDPPSKSSAEDLPGSRSACTARDVQKHPAQFHRTHAKSKPKGDELQSGRIVKPRSSTPKGVRAFLHDWEAVDSLRSLGYRSIRLRAD